METSEQFTKEEVNEANADITRARILAAQVAELLYAQEETTQQKIIASGIVFSAMCALHGVAFKDAVTLMVGCFELAEDFFDAAGPIQ
jgi:hypothetical protein